MPTAREVIAKCKIGTADYYGILGNELADSILSALDKAGFVCVPREPTDRMVAAGGKHTATDYGAALAYQAMLSAHAKHDEGEVIG